MGAEPDFRDRVAQESQLVPRHTKPQRTRQYLKRRGNKREAQHPKKKRTAAEQLDIAFDKAAVGRGWFFKSAVLAENEDDREQK